MRKFAPIAIIRAALQAFPLDIICHLSLIGRQRGTAMIEKKSHRGGR